MPGPKLDTSIKIKNKNSDGVCSKGAYSPRLRQILRI